MKQEPDPNSGPRQHPSKTDSTQEWSTPLPEELPHPTAWPAVLAFGCALMGWGALTSRIISVIGIGVFILGAAGWIGRIRHEQH